MVWGKGGLLNASSGRPLSVSRFRRRHGRPCHLRSLRAGLCLISETSPRLSQASHASTQRCAQLYWRMFALGRMVWIQRGQRAVSRQPGDQRLRGHPFWRGRSRSGMERRGVVAQRQTQRAGRDFRRGSWSGRDYSGRRFRLSHVGDRDRADRRRCSVTSWSRRSRTVFDTTTRSTRSAFTERAAR